MEEATSKPGKKQAVQPGALDIAKSTWRKSLLKERKAKPGVMKDVLPKPPTGASAARKLQNPEHVDIVKGLMNVPSARDMGLSVKGEVIHDKMVIAATRQLSASTGSLYSRYTAHCTLYNGLGTLYTVHCTNNCKYKRCALKLDLRKSTWRKQKMGCRT